MKNSADAVRVNHRNNAPTKIARHGRAKQHKIYDNLPKTAQKSAAIIPVQPKLRITPPMQAQILRLFMEGWSLCEIARRTGRARQTVTKVVRAPDIQAMLQEAKEKLVGTSDAWVESIDFAVTHELNGRLALKLLTAFGIIPSPAAKMTPEKLNGWEQNGDPEIWAKARALGAEALRRASALSLEGDDLEKLARKD